MFFWSSHYILIPCIASLSCLVPRDSVVTGWWPAWSHQSHRRTSGASWPARCPRETLLIDVLYQIMCFLLFAFGLKLFPFLRMNANFLLNISFILGKIMYTFSTDHVSRGTLLQGRAWTPNFVPNGEKLLLKNCQNICQSRILRDWHQWACQSFLGVLLPASALQGQGPQEPPAWLLPGPLSAPQGLRVSEVLWSL